MFLAELEGGFKFYAMSETKYSENLKDIRWVTKRRRMILRDGKKCTVCGSVKNLQVHHTFYYTDYREPWRYPDDSLLTVCKDCHKKYHEEHEHEFKPPPKIFIKKKVKVNRKHKRIQTKKTQINKKFKGYKEKRVSLLSLQAKRLGYKQDGLGHWIKLDRQISID